MYYCLAREIQRVGTLSLCLLLTYSWSTSRGNRISLRTTPPRPTAEKKPQEDRRRVQLKQILRMHWTAVYHLLTCELRSSYEVIIMLYPHTTKIECCTKSQELLSSAHLLNSVKPILHAALVYVVNTSCTAVVMEKKAPIKWQQHKDDQDRIYFCCCCTSVPTATSCKHTNTGVAGR